MPDLITSLTLCGKLSDGPPLLLKCKEDPVLLMMKMMGLDSGWLTETATRAIPEVTGTVWQFLRMNFLF